MSKPQMKLVVPITAKPRKTYTPKRKAEVVALVQGGMSISAVSRQTGISYPSVQAWVKASRALVPKGSLPVAKPNTLCQHCVALEGGQRFLCCPGAY